MKKIDCVDVKREGAKKVREKTLGLDLEEEEKFWEEAGKKLKKQKDEFSNKEVKETV
jgi:hypothetical protein